jgi:hypothetical protein
MLRTLLIGSLAAMGGLGTTIATAQDQRADPDFDTTVAAPTYTSRHPAVLFDEAHRNLHTAGGLYKPFADLIGHDGYRVESNKKPLSRALLDRYEILIIANAAAAEEEGPRAPWDEGERPAEPRVEGEDPLEPRVEGEAPPPPRVEVRLLVMPRVGGNRPPAARQALRDVESKVVEGWVRSGGSLLLITDMNLWGAASRNLAERFGVEMSQGVTFDPTHSVPGRHEWLVFTGESGLLGDHPITRGRDPSERLHRVVTYCGQSLRGPRGSVPFLRLSQAAIDQNPGGWDHRAAGRCQGLAMTHGKGRVVVFGEAGALSAQIGPGGRFGMNLPGNDNRQLVLNVMHWLSGALPADPPAASARADSPREAPRPGR